MSIRKVKLSELNLAIEGGVDLFIASASFEARCLSVARALSSERVNSALIAQNFNNRRRHGEYPKLLLREFGNKADLIRLDSRDPVFSVDALYTSLLRALRSEPQSILVDITTFTHETLLVLIRLLSELAVNSELTFVYNPAEEYSVGDPPALKWLSRGVDEVRSVLGYPGSGRPTHRLHLIVLVGFEHERVLELVRAVEPNEITLGYGESGVDDDTSRASAIGLEQVRAVYGSANTFTFPVYDPIATDTQIREQIGRHQGFNTVIAPMNTKLSTVGASFVGLTSPAVQIVYAPALVYNHLNYSKPSDCAILFDSASAFKNLDLNWRSSAAA